MWLNVMRILTPLNKREFMHELALNLRILSIGRNPSTQIPKGKYTNRLSMKGSSNEDD